MDNLLSKYVFFRPLYILGHFVEIPSGLTDRSEGYVKIRYSE